VVASLAVVLAAQRMPTSLATTLESPPTADLGRYHSTQQLADGSLRTTISGDPINRRGPAGQWVPIDNSLQVGLDAAHPLSAPGAIGAAQFGAGSADLLRFQFNNDAVWLGLDGTLLPAPQRLAGDVVDYQQVLPDVDLAYHLTPTGAKEDIRITGPDAPATINFVLGSSQVLGAPRRLANGDLLFAENVIDGDLRLRLPHPIVRDVSGVLRPCECSLSATPLASGWRIALQISPDWLSLQLRPLVIDPEIAFVQEQGVTTRQSAPVDDVCADMSHPFCASTDFLTVGSGGGAGSATYNCCDNATFLRFDLSAITPLKPYILRAEFQAPANFAGPDSLAAGAAISMRRLTAPWALGDSGYTINRTREYSPIASSSVSASNSWILPTAVVQHWADSPSDNNGVELNQQSYDMQWAAVFSSPPPQLVLTYAPTAVGVPTGPLLVTAATCAQWAGVGSLNTLIQSAACVVVQPGTYTIPYQVFIPGGHILTGVAGLRDSTILRADRTVDWAKDTGVIDTTAPYDKPSQLSHLTIDGNSNRVQCTDTPLNPCPLDGANIGVSAPSMIMTDVRVANARCDGVGAYEHLLIQHLFTTVIADSVIEGSGWNCAAGAAPPGGGLYIHPVNGPADRVEVSGTTIQNNAGPGVEIYGSQTGGLFTGNTVVNNQRGYAAISLHASSNWTINGNVLKQPQGTPGKTNCIYPSATGSHGAAIYLCALDGSSTGNVIGPNPDVEGEYGVVASWNNTAGYRSAGNTFVANVITASLGGCVDHNGAGANTWQGNNCQSGPAPANPTYY
jgi:parallel beta-helix repeat protein